VQSARWAQKLGELFGQIEQVGAGQVRRSAGGAP
jgi:hypothetical protein